MHLFQFDVGFNAKSLPTLSYFEDLGLSSFCIAQSVEMSFA
jgi:hypothetical protein